ncbi:MAG: histidinol dehydrogenase [Planctomycetota bacterium]
MTTRLLPTYDLSTGDGVAAFDTRLDRLRRSATVAGDFHRIAAELIEDTGQRGDTAIVEHMRRFTDPTFTADQMRVAPDVMADADQQLRAEQANLSAAIDRAIAHVAEYQRHLVPADAEPMTIAGAELGMRWTPISPAGLLVPGGSATLFSTLIMLAVPAIAAGVSPDDITVVSPPPTIKGDADGVGTTGDAKPDISPITLAVAHRLGLSKVYRIGGPPAVAALALGTETIDPVSLIAGPGHPVVQAAKLQMAGTVGIDGYYGASEIVTVADSTADPSCIAADLLAQAEHDPGKCFLIAWEPGVIDAIEAELAKQLTQRQRIDAIKAGLANESCAVLCDSRDAAAELVDRLAAEHVNLAVTDPRAFLAQVQHGGEFFLGDTTPVAAGDYYAGPSHCLPTGTTARFTSGVSVYTFLKRSGVVGYPDGMPAQAIADIATMAEAEGLDAHAASVQQRHRG